MKKPVRSFRTERRRGRHCFRGNCYASDRTRNGRPVHPRIFPGGRSCVASRRRGAGGVANHADFAAAVFTRINRWRRRFGIFYGDSGIFCRRVLFEELGGFKPFPVLEDYDFARRMARRGKVALLPAPIFVSGRRWKHSSVPRTLWSWVLIQGLYWLGVSPEKLGKLYRAIR